MASWGRERDGGSRLASSPRHGDRDGNRCQQQGTATEGTDRARNDGKDQAGRVVAITSLLRLPKGLGHLVPKEDG